MVTTVIFLFILPLYVFVIQDLKHLHAVFIYALLLF